MTTKVPVELSSTPGIVDGSNATAITIDSSENSTFAGNITIPADGTIASASGDITLDAPDDIFLDADGGNIRFKDAGTTHYHFSNGGNSLGHIFSQTQVATKVVWILHFKLMDQQLVIQ